MIRIASSYRIIKSDNVTLSEYDTSKIETKIEIKPESISNLFESLDEDTQIDCQELEEVTDDNEAARQEFYEKLEKMKEDILKQANLDAEKIRLDAKATGYKEGFEKAVKDGFPKGIEKGTKKGYEDGYKEAVENAKEEAYEIRQRAISLLKEAEVEVERYYFENQDRIIKLAGQMAEAIAHHTIDYSSENILLLIKPIIQEFRNNDTIIITCHPRSYNYLKKSMFELEKKHENIKFIVLEDDSLEKNGCVIENENQIIDLQIGKQVKNILEKIRSLG